MTDNKDSITVDGSKLRWRMCRDDNMRIWPNADRIWYFSNNANTRYMPHSLISENDSDSPYKASNNNDHVRVIVPKRLTDTFDRHGIIIAGYALHHKGYYHSRMNKDFTDLICVVDGEFTFKFDGKKFLLKKGDALVLPPEKTADSFPEKGRAFVLWAHFKNIPEWNSIFGSVPFTKRLDNFEQINSLMEMYRAEVFNKERSMAVLESIADFIAMFFRREFSVGVKAVSPKSFERGVKKIQADLARRWTLSSAASSFETSPKNLDSVCRKNSGLSFSKLLASLRMKCALSMLKCGASNEEIAKAVGYCGAYAFSKAFKIYYGSSPKNYVRGV